VNGIIDGSDALLCQEDMIYQLELETITKALPMMNSWRAGKALEMTICVGN
jgi:hypothetical protein